MKHTGIKFGNILSCKCLVQTLAAVTLVSNAAFAVNDGETIAWFPLDDDFLSSVNTAGNGTATQHIPEGGAISFVSYADSRPILDASGNVVRESKYVTMDKSRVYIPLSGFDLGSDVTGVTFEMFANFDVSTMPVTDTLVASPAKGAAARRRLAFASDGLRPST